ncbi:hypothetical protein K491DRAFT_676341 [Lophiostoma macrostomum CBS 122681]|uniref:Uncharacterized protein n=1 Tax=Lophiostoma macrostomum CBS 122681 TaxID=1314788 RepID=A0A6A6TGR2_9PLEO|nr:hypothetical protein K491DRAFT_676341 [Lophiostoma macrostomum CBS 122681]
MWRRPVGLFLKYTLPNTLQSFLDEVRNNAPTNIEYRGYQKAREKISNTISAPNYAPDVLAARAVKREESNQTIGEHLDEFESFRDVNLCTFDELVQMIFEASLKGNLRTLQSPAVSLAGSAGNVRKPNLTIRKLAKEHTDSAVYSHHYNHPEFFYDSNRRYKSIINQTYARGVATQSPLRNQVMDFDSESDDIQASDEEAVYEEDRFDEPPSIYGVHGRNVETLQFNSRKLKRPIENDG